MGDAVHSHCDAGRSLITPYFYDRLITLRLCACDGHLLVRNGHPRLGVFRLAKTEEGKREARRPKNGHTVSYAAAVRVPVGVGARLGVSALAAGPTHTHARTRAWPIRAACT